LKKWSEQGRGKNEIGETEWFKGDSIQGTCILKGPIGAEGKSLWKIDDPKKSVVEKGPQTVVQGGLRDVALRPCVHGIQKVRKIGKRCTEAKIKEKDTRRGTNWAF